MEILEVLAIFSKYFDMKPWNLVYRPIVSNFKCVWKIALVGQIFGSFYPK